jgi:hypothetical protein
MKTVARLGIAALAILSSLAPAAAGQRGGAHSSAASPVPSSAGLSISRPIGSEISSVRTNPPPGMSAPVVSPFDARPGTYNRPSPSRGPYLGGPSIGYGISTPVVVDGVTGGTANAGIAPADENAAGLLFVDVTPRNTRVFVDSAYVGSVDDLRAGGIRLPRGRHWLDLEAPEHDKKTVEVSITPGQPLHYRFELPAASQATAIVLAPRAPQTIYTIPGCYGGNRPPVQTMLPAGCDIANVRVLRPQQP